MVPMETLIRRFQNSILLGGTVFVLVVGAAIMGCGGRSTPGDVTSQLIKIDGSSTVYPVTEAVTEEFMKINPNMQVTVGISGTGGGFNKFCNGETNISNASRPIKQVEVEACAEAGIRYVELSIAYDGVSVVVNPKNDWIDSLTVTELQRMWKPDAQGKILRWNQINTDWPDRELHLFGPGAASGTFDYFTEVIVGFGGASRGDFTSSADDNVLVQGVTRDELALGFFGYAYYKENREDLKVIAINNEISEDGDVPIIPSPETIRDGTYHPLSRPLFMYVSLEDLSRSEVAAFVDFFLTDGVDLVRDVGYVPLPDSEYRLMKQRVTSGLQDSQLQP